MRRIYLASSWRNSYQPDMVSTLRNAGHEVYDFRNPPHGKGGFSWSQVDPAWQSWTPEAYHQALGHPIAQEGFNADKEGMEWADTCVLLLPCGRSAHIEAGWFAGKPFCELHVLQLDHQEPELMYLLADGIHSSLNDLLAALTKDVPTLYPRPTEDVTWP